MKVYYVK